MLVALNWPPTASFPRHMSGHTDVSERARTERLDAIRAELQQRIRPICRHMPQELFLEMVEGMAAVQLKYELKNTHESD